MLLPGTLVEVDIQSLSYGGGRGVGRVDGFVVFVPFAAPGDRLQVRVLQSKKSFAEAEIVKILRSSPLRRQAPCPVFGICGGCQWQHIPYSEQLAQKQGFIGRTLQKYKDHLLQIVPSPKEFHYRNRIQLHQRQGQVGFLKRGTDQLVPIESCWIAEPSLNEKLQDLELPLPKRFELAVSADGIATQRQDSKDPEAILFSQVNTLANEKLIHLVVEWAGELVKSLRIGQIFDFYAGGGNLTLPLAETLQLPTVGVELSRSSVELGQKRAVGKPLVSFEAKSVEDFLGHVSSQKLRRALAVLDPPREGLSKSVVQALLETKPRALILVGCQLMNFARDLDRLVAGGYQVEKICPLDMFPQTDHVEMVAQLTLRYDVEIVDQI